MSFGININNLVATHVSQVLRSDYYLYAVYIDKQSSVDVNKQTMMRELEPVDCIVCATLPTKPSYKQIVSVKTGMPENITIYKVSILRATAPIRRNYLLVPQGSNSMYSLLTELPDQMIDTVTSDIELRYEGERWV